MGAHAVDENALGLPQSVLDLLAALGQASRDDLPHRGGQKHGCHATSTFWLEAGCPGAVPEHVHFNAGLWPHRVFPQLVSSKVVSTSAPPIK